MPCTRMWGLSGEKLESDISLEFLAMGGRMDELGARRRMAGCYQREEIVSGPGWWLWAGKKWIFKRNLIYTYLVKTLPKEGKL